MRRIAHMRRNVDGLGNRAHENFDTEPKDKEFFGVGQYPRAAYAGKGVAARAATRIRI